MDCLVHGVTKMLHMRIILFWRAVCPAQGLCHVTLFSFFTFMVLAGLRHVFSHSKENRASNKSFWENFIFLIQILQNSLLLLFLIKELGWRYDKIVGWTKKFTQVFSYHLMKNWNKYFGQSNVLWLYKRYRTKEWNPTKCWGKFGNSGCDGIAQKWKQYLPVVLLWEKNFYVLLLFSHSVTTDSFAGLQPPPASSVHEIFQARILVWVS